MKLLNLGKKIKEKTFKNYIIENKNSFYRIAYKYVRNEQDALDIVQESILKGLSKIDKLENVDCIKPWFYTILINTSIDYTRKSKKYTQIVEKISTDTYIDRDIETDIDIQMALDNLPKEYKTVVMLRYFEDMKISDIAKTLDENINTVKTRLYKALKLLKIEIDE
ncbi:RNA polymerase sigma factor [Romboutsia sedimentorum]|uniref:RNA polymerase sigma factor n=1 Tax=Romboutsia sedimentorum TaxID=1368474 RepID=A0ABT7EEQ1_9FIRM|nr:RNA polymerase sigma factor [Romboutsia sedimentorum]MDK2563965.1 RNA polymerase sigma factor [Romboutsia sedimentorum]